jgi:hypothetical protein
MLLVPVCLVAKIIYQRTYLDAPIDFDTVAYFLIPLVVKL